MGLIHNLYIICLNTFEAYFIYILQIISFPVKLSHFEGIIWFIGEYMYFIIHLLTNIKL